MCAASESSASECARTPTTTSPTMKARVSASASPRRRASSPPPCACPCAWSCTYQSCRGTHHLVRQRPPPLPCTLELPRLERARGALHEEALRLGREGIAVLPQPPRDPMARGADEHRRLVRTRVERSDSRSASTVRQFIDPAANTDSGLTGSSLFERPLARPPAGEAVDMRWCTDHEEVDILERRQGLVHRDEPDLSFRRQRRRDPLRDLLRVPEPGLIDDERSHRTPPFSFLHTICPLRCRSIGARADPLARIPHLT